MRGRDESATAPTGPTAPTGLTAPTRPTAPTAPPARRRSPVAFDANPAATEMRDGWGVVLRYQDEGTARWPLDGRPEPPPPLGLSGR